jgi:beta-exotoxin I transport system ATP-binding protein
MRRRRSAAAGSTCGRAAPSAASASSNRASPEADSRATLIAVHAIATIGLTKQYGRQRLAVRLPLLGSIFTPQQSTLALDSLDIAVGEGEIFGFLGPNGAGKSTTIRLLLGFLHPTAGDGRVLGLDIRRDSVAIRSRIGYLPGGIALYDSLTGEALLDYFAALSGRPPVRRADLCDQLELSSRTLRRLVRDYSRGMRQKIGIIQALQHDPELAILDEPTEGLDPLMQRAFYQILDTLKAKGRTIFFSSHVLSEVERVCDRVAIIRRGRLVATEEIASLLARQKRNVNMRLNGAPPRMDGVPGVSSVEASDGRLTCRVEGDIRPFLAAIARAPIVDLTIEPAHLEEAFLELYEEGEP